MEENIFLRDNPAVKFEDYLDFDDEGRLNLGDTLPVVVYRMLEFSLKEVLRDQLGKDMQVELFRKAGRRAGEYFAQHLLDVTLPVDDFIRELQDKMQEMKIGVLRIEDINEVSGKVILTIAEDADCSGLPVLGETVCNYDEGFLAGILSSYTGKNYDATEIDCWATGDRVCRFCAEVHEN
ncbi:MAG: 4-vinyl reductase [Clostridia bacterium]|nr:4-vinyl reductase [Clostridia bacterium]